MKRLMARGSLLRKMLPCLICSFCFGVQLSSARNVNTVTVGLNVPLSGAYKDQGKDQERAYRLAIDLINEAGGVLGKKIHFELRDTQTNPEVARANALEMIHKHGAVMITGGSSSAVAIAQSDVCQENRVIFMAALTHSNATTGHMKSKAGNLIQKAHRHTFRWFFNAWMTGKALTPYLIKRFGKGTEYYYITADYTWGRSLEESMRWGAELAGCDTLGTIKTPLGQKDFRTELRQAKEAAPDVLVLVLFGNDMVVAMKQAREMGLKSKMNLVVPLMELNMAHGAGIAAMEGVISTKNWYWGLKDKYPGSKDFVDRFRSKYKKAPGSSAACAWVAVHQWADAAQTAGTFESAAIIRTLENQSFTLLKGEERWRDWDHQAVSSVYIVEGKSNRSSKEEWDLLEVKEEIDASQVMRSISENPVMLEPL